MAEERSTNEKQWTEERILAYYDTFDYHDYTILSQKQLLLAFDELPDSLQNQVDNFREESVYNFIKNVALTQIYTYENCCSLMDENSGEYKATVTEMVDGVVKEIPIIQSTIAKIKKPSQVVYRMADLDFDNFSEYFVDILREAKYTIDVVDTVRTSEGVIVSRKVNANISWVDCFRATDSVLFGGVPVKTTFPTQSILLTDIVSRAYFNGDMSVNKEEPSTYTIAKTGKKGNEKLIQTTASISFQNLPDGVSVSDELKKNPYANTVHSAICELMQQSGSDCFTFEMIYKVIVHDPNARMTENWRRIIQDSITLMMKSIVKIESKSEAQLYHHNIRSYEGNVLYMEIVTKKINGQVVNCVHVLREPIFFTLAKGKNQIARISADKIRLPIDYTEMNMRVRNYLLQRCEAVRGGNSNIILFESLYYEIGVRQNSDTSQGAMRKLKLDIRERVYKILEGFIATGYMTHYQLESKDKKLYARESAKRLRKNELPFADSKGRTIRAVVVYVPSKSRGKLQ